MRQIILKVTVMSQAAERWAQRAASGCLTDEQLAEALKYELGIFGGSSATDNGPALTYQGNGLKIWASWEITNHVTTKPTFQGVAPSPWPSRRMASATHSRVTRETPLRPSQLTREAGEFGRSSRPLSL